MDQWAQIQPTLSASYMVALAITTNHVESIFLLTEEVSVFVRIASTALHCVRLLQSMKDLIRRGIEEGVVECAPASAVQDPEKIKNILRDTLAVRQPLLVHHKKHSDTAAAHFRRLMSS
ncbi:hypothetical protein FA95DRAFT_641165 [Auriscalpium vulgare]|uniref:Uncharacterized protein n=1 Tax=Auriscalpium vulgare TaxID=40419 RepID=A0ACB8S162_9AGAM|nr:hypothetical protein FA95DRAFT_641165 [Auriscalpium vulgare]